MDFKSLLPLIIGLSVWIYGTVLLVIKLSAKITFKKIPEEN